MMTAETRNVETANILYEQVVNPLSIRSDRPLNPWAMEILRAIDEALQEFNCRYMLIGATARGILLFHILGRAAMRHSGR